jgi:HAD superfamily hydrolase (TIGR01484 family)
MTRSYRNIDSQLAYQIRLVMADVDGTLIASGDLLSPVVFKAIRGFEEVGITVGLVSGRTLPGLESMALELETSGPIIAENGGVAKLQVGGEAVDLGYSRQPAIKALEELKKLFPGAIEEREDNKYRSVDIVFKALGIDTEELREHLKGVELLDSGYIFHLMQKGVSKGKTLMKLLPEIGDGTLSATEVMVFGDSLTDLSLFEMFPHSVLIVNPRLSSEHRGTLRNAAGYTSELPFGEGFAEVAFHILGSRLA